MSESPGTLSQNRLNLWGAGHWALWALGFPWEIAPLMPEPRTPGAECPTQWGTGPAAQIDLIHKRRHQNVTTGNFMKSQTPPGGNICLPFSSLKWRKRRELGCHERLSLPGSQYSVGYCITRVWVLHRLRCTGIGGSADQLPTKSGFLLNELGWIRCYMLLLELGGA